MQSWEVDNTDKEGIGAEMSRIVLRARGSHDKAEVRLRQLRSLPLRAPAPFHYFSAYPYPCH